MRKWMRDRNKRRTRKNSPQPPGGDQPPPQQPSLDRGDAAEFPPDDIGNRVDAPIAENSPSAEPSGSAEERRAASSRRRGRRGRGRQRGAVPGNQTKPSLPAPGGLTGEAAEAADILEPAAPDVSADNERDSAAEPAS